MPLSERAAAAIAQIDAVSGANDDSARIALAEDFERHSPVREAIERGDLASARKMLAFRPLGEANLPKGFPPYTPVGVIEVKHYPPYRKAVGDGFWPLFRHITTRKIPMTAPVEMREATDGSGREKEWMAFLYEDTSVGKLGDAGSVEVVDTPAMVAVSLGVRGDTTEKAVAEARARLRAWVAESDQWRVAEGEGAERVFGYNSPMVRPRDRYWEAQLVIEPKTDSSP